MLKPLNGEVPKTVKMKSDCAVDEWKFTQPLSEKT